MEYQDEEGDRRMSAFKVFYKCDEERCDPCQHCGHTSEITHAKNFTLVGNAFFENTTGEDDPRILIISKMGDDIINKVEELKRGYRIKMSDEKNTLNDIKSGKGLPPINTQL